MLNFGFMKYYLVIVISLTYLFVERFFNIIPWQTPTHIEVILIIITSISSILAGGMIISNLADDMFGRTESFSLFHTKKVWSMWSWVFLPILIYCVYKWENFGIMSASFLLYFGFKAMIKNHNRHVEKYKSEVLVSKARQETAEKVQL